MSFPHVGCNVTTCPADRCRCSGVCQYPLPGVESPPLAPRCCGTNDKPYCDCSVPSAPRTIIAFTGLAGAGKSTAAQHLVASGRFQRVRFAGPLKAMMAALGLSHDEIEGSRKELPCALLGGKTPRYAMQTIGTEWGRDLIDSDLWIRAWQNAVANVSAGVGVVVDDCRFPNEAAVVKAAGGVLVRVERPGAGASGYQHSSETYSLPALTTLLNTGSMGGLHHQVDVMVRDLSWTAP